MMIEKIASATTGHLRPSRRFVNGRSGFRAFLSSSFPRRDGVVLLPGYIGWSAREGSGVFDPVQELSLPYAFYRMKDDLTIDLEHLRSRLKNGDVRLLVLIHYFGYVDPNYAEAVRLAREYGAFVLEDEAHALLSDLVGGACGRLGDAAIFSLHKLLPVKKGGMLVMNSPSDPVLRALPDEASEISSPWDYDLWTISQARRKNASELAELLIPLAGDVECLRPRLPRDIVPQTLPVIIHRVSRDKLYDIMNQSGFGVVSLYHTMIDRLLPGEHPEAHRLASRILNLPVHQDVGEETLKMLVARLAQCVRDLPAVAR